MSSEGNLSKRLKRLKREPVYLSAPDPNGNRAERRLAAKLAKKTRKGAS